MKAVVVHNPGKNSSLSIDEVPTPEPGGHEVLVKIKATALNRADLHQRSGNYPPPEGASEILGLEMAGVVEAVGPEVERWSAGDAVCALLPGGGYAQYCVIPEQMAMAVPGDLGFEKAAAIPETFLTAYQSLNWIGELQRGETVLIHAGASGVGTAAIQLAVNLINAEVVTTAGEPHKLEACRELGATLAINYRSEDFAAVIKEEMGENPIDLIVDFIGAPYWQQNLSVLNTDGRVVYLSFLGGHELPEMSLAPLLRKRLKIMGSTLRSRSESYKMRLSREFIEHTTDLFEEQILAPVIDSVYDWEQTEEAHRYMSENKNTGKIVLTGM